MKTLSDQRERGAALIVSLLMLLILTILALATINTSTVDMKIAYNTQLQTEAETIAQMRVEDLLSNYRNFTTWCSSYPPTCTTPWSPVIGPTSKSLNAETVNGQSYTVTLYRPVCVGYADVGADGEDCSASSLGQGTVLPCNSAHWDVRVEVQETNTGARAIFHQGVRMIINSTEMTRYNGPNLDTNLRTFCNN